MHKDRIELSRGRVIETRTYSEDRLDVVRHSRDSRPLRFFIDLIENDVCLNIWEGDDYRQALKVAADTAIENDLQFTNLGGAHLVAKDGGAA
ncbi:MAG: hypothetical protein AAGE61_00930 [Pseudomonadota bacterium]